MSNYPTRFGLPCLVAALLLVGCTTKQEMAKTAPPVMSPPASASTPQPVNPSIVPGSLQDFRVNVGDTVHFGYDKYLVEENDRPTLQRQATWLQKYSSIRVTVEGHCDERGTREYNLALGSRRANAVKEYLVSSGVSPARIDTISYGKERPICTESSETCWAQNRRGVTTISAGATSPMQAADGR